MKKIGLRVVVWGAVWCGALVAISHAETFSLGHGLRGRLVSAESVPRAGASDADRPPLEGPLTYLAFTITDERSFDDLDWSATAHLGLDGDLLPDATAASRIGILDSGASTHLLSYENSNELGVDENFRTGSPLTIGGAGGQVDVEICEPIGIFVHGLQDLAPGDVLDTSLVVGQGNFRCAANTEFNATVLDIDLPTAVGAPMLAYFAASIRNSEPVVLFDGEERISSPSVTFFVDSDPLSNPLIPSYGSKIFLELVPGGDRTVNSPAIPDGNGGHLLIFPGLIGGGALYFTASNNLLLQSGGTSQAVKLMVDTGAQACLMSEIVASDLGLDTLDPPFEVEVEGVGGTVTAPGVYLDLLTIPVAGGGTISYTNVPFIVLNVNGPKPDNTTGILDGILGSNLLGNRDYVFNGAVDPPYLDVSDPAISPKIAITAIRHTESGMEVDWRSEPAAPVLQLDVTSSLFPAEADWTGIATGELPTILGTLTTTNISDQAMYRLRAP